MPKRLPAAVPWSQTPPPSHPVGSDTGKGKLSIFTLATYREKRKEREKNSTILGERMSRILARQKVVFYSWNVVVWGKKKMASNICFLIWGIDWNTVLRIWDAATATVRPLMFSVIIYTVLFTCKFCSCAFMIICYIDTHSPLRR